MSGFDISYAGALGGGILSFVSPCVLPLVPAYLCFLSGTSLGQLSGEEPTEDGAPDLSLSPHYYSFLDFLQSSWPLALPLPPSAAYFSNTS